MALTQSPALTASAPPAVFANGTVNAASFAPGTTPLAPPHRIQKSVTVDALSAFKPCGYSIPVFFHFDGDNLLPKPKDYFELTQMI